MDVKIPANYRQSFKWLGNLDAPSAIFLGVGVVVSLRTLTGQAPIVEKIPEIAVAMGAAAVFGLVRFPMDLYGDRMVTWLQRAVAFYRRERKASYFAGTVNDRPRGR